MICPSPSLPAEVAVDRARPDHVLERDHLLMNWTGAFGSFSTVRLGHRSACLRLEALDVGDVAACARRASGPAPACRSTTRSALPASSACSSEVSAPSSCTSAHAKGRSSGWLRSGSATHAHCLTTPASADLDDVVERLAGVGVVLERRDEHPPGGGAAADAPAVAQPGEERADHRADAAAVRELHGERGLPRGHRRSRTHSRSGDKRLRGAVRRVRCRSSENVFYCAAWPSTSPTSSSTRSTRCPIGWR